VVEAARNLGVQPARCGSGSRASVGSRASADAVEEKALRRKVRELEGENQRLRLSGRS